MGLRSGRGYPWVDAVAPTLSIRTLPDLHSQVESFGLAKQMVAHVTLLFGFFR